MAVITDIANCSLNPTLNGPDGATDVPSTLDDAIRYALSFIAQLRDGLGEQPGALKFFPASTAPPGYLKANGALVSRTTYARLWTFAQGQIVSEATWATGYWGCFAAGDGVTTFRLPDFRGLVLRGLDESAGRDPSRVLGLYQADQVANHVHPISDPTHGHGYTDPGHGHTTDAQGYHDHVVTNAVTNEAGVGFGSGGPGNLGIFNKVTNGNGNHAHNVLAAATGINIAGAGTGISILNNTGGGAETRMKNIALPVFIKY